jgi:Cd2+/Zn2+-exporting ATPase
VSATCTVCELHAESTFKIEGMDCREEVTLLERRFKTLPGIEDFSADVMGQRLHVKYDAARLSTSTIADAVADTGMRAWLEHEEPVAGAPTAERTRRSLVVVSGAALVIGLLLEHSAAVAAAPYLFAVGIGAGLGAVGRRAWNSLRARVLDINVLMILAVAGAIVLRQYSEAAAVIFLFAVAQALEARTLERARLAITALMDLTPADALVRDDAGERRVGVDAIRPGAIIIVRPGEKVPLDGAVVSGHSEVNQSPVTGESLPIEKGPGDEVFAGTINGRGAIDVRVTRLRRDTTLARIIHLVERAQSQRAPAQTTIERFARVYTPLVIVLAMAVAVVPPLVFGSVWQEWLYRALVLLVVSCPCALVISTPVSIVAALASAARKGVLIKGGAHLERASTIRCVAFDKTGTLTRGAPEVVEVLALNGAQPAAILQLAASVERRSAHPIAQAILRHAAAGDGAAAPAERVMALPGRGTEGLVGGRAVLLGNHRLFEERSLCSPEIHERLAELGAAGRTPVLVALGDQAIGILAIADRPREASRATVELLREQGVQRVIMLTGDSRGTAAAIAADVALMADELLKIPYALRLSRATVRNIKVNLAISIVLKAAFIVAAVTGVATLWMAVLADTGASVIVIANALRLLRAD